MGQKTGIQKSRPILSIVTCFALGSSNPAKNSLYLVHFVISCIQIYLIESYLHQTAILTSLDGP